mgnify:CR=1
MDNVIADPHWKKWSDLIKTSNKMLQFARDELNEGNLLSSKSIFDSLKKSIEPTAKDIPEGFKG